jgi:hypothetical protein
VRITAADGSALDDVEITRARAFMPAHNHDGTFAPDISAGEGPSEYHLDDLNLWMLGPWEVQIWASSPTAGDDYLVLPVCVR